MFALFDRDDTGAEGLHFFAGLDQAGFLGQFARLAVVENEHVDTLEQFEERGLGNVNPEVHRVGDDELGFLHLAEHLQLQFGGDVGQENKVARFVMVGKGRREGFDNIERDRAGLAGVHIPHVFAGPAEGLARIALHAFEVDAALLQKVPMVGREIFADDGHEVDRREIPGGHRGVGSRAAEKIETFLDRRFNVIERDGANNENGHGAAQIRRAAPRPQVEIRVPARVRGCGAACPLPTRLGSGSGVEFAIGARRLGGFRGRTARDRR